MLHFPVSIMNRFQGYPSQIIGTRLFGNGVSPNPGLGGMRDVTSVIIAHEETQSDLLFSNCGCYISK